MRLPKPRGPLSEELFTVLVDRPRDLPHTVSDRAHTLTTAVHLDEDFQITLFVCYALHYRGFDGVDDDWEWHPSLLATRAVLEHSLERCLRTLVTIPEVAPANLPRYLIDFGTPKSGPSLSTHMKSDATIDHFREFAIHRSLYQLMEADPHTFAIPRITGRAKCALVEIQADEYGGGMPGRTHAELFKMMMAELDLDSSYGAYVECIPAVSISVVNTLSFFALHRRLRGALLGQLAISEIGSSVSNRRFSQGLARLGASNKARLFYDEHVEADAVHEQVAAHDMCGSFVTEIPSERNNVLLGAIATSMLKGLSNKVMTSQWERSESSLRVPAELTRSTRSEVGETHAG